VFSDTSICTKLVYVEGIVSYHLKCVVSKCVSLIYAEYLIILNTQNLLWSLEIFILLLLVYY